MVPRHGPVDGPAELDLVLDAQRRLLARDGGVVVLRVLGARPGLVAVPSSQFPQDLEVRPLLLDGHDVLARLRGRLARLGPGRVDELDVRARVADADRGERLRRVDAPGREPPPRELLELQVPQEPRVEEVEHVEQRQQQAEQRAELAWAGIG